MLFNPVISAPASILLSLTASLSFCLSVPAVVNVHVSSDSVTEAERRGVAVFRGRPSRHTPLMERRRMDAALLVLFLGHLAAALEVPLDRKGTDHALHSTFASQRVQMD